MAKKTKRKKTLVEQILDKAHIAHQRLSLNALEADLPSGIQASDIYKTLALIGDKTGPLIGIIPLTEHLSEKQLAKVSGNKKVSMIPKKTCKRQLATFTGQTILLGFVKSIPFLFLLMKRPSRRDR